MAPPDISADDIIDTLDGYVAERLSVNEVQVIDTLDSIDLTEDQLKHILQICQSGYQMSLTERARPETYQAIIAYVRHRLSLNV